MYKFLLFLALTSQAAEIHFTWDPSDTIGVGYTLQCTPEEGPSSFFSTLGTDVIASLQPGNWECSVIASLGDLVSEPSNVVGVSVPGVLNARLVIQSMASGQWMDLHSTQVSIPATNSFQLLRGVIYIE